mmetsp:Transcript_26835/g.32929  ORF Transcript_26835/g.32929 Transcript_26835/m.32929 type:complete len:372 (-) Transcript_26835:523-1638(-)
MSGFYSKKSRAEMRKRKRKNEKVTSQSQSQRPDRSSRPESENTDMRTEAPETNLPTTSTQRQPAPTTRVSIPPDLTSTQARKFRKDARRTARKEHSAPHVVVFLNPDGSVFNDGTINADTTETTQTDTTENTPPPKKKKRKEFPRINDLLAEQVTEKKRMEKQKSLESQQAKIPLETRDLHVALDCEMVGTGIDGKNSALARVSLIGWGGLDVQTQVLLDTFVKVPERITDFRTWVSGVRAKNINADTAMELHACRNMVGKLLKGKILIGHSLSNDLKALMLDHPRRDVRDTARYGPYMRARTVGGRLQSRKLKDLAEEMLGLKIQQVGKSHSSIDDAGAAMELYKVVREDWEKELAFKLGKKAGKSRKPV